MRRPDLKSYAPSYFIPMTPRFAKAIFLWRPSTAPQRLRTLLTVELPPGMALPPKPADYRTALFLKVDELLTRGIEEFGQDQIAMSIEGALPGEQIELDEPGGWASAIMFSEQMMPILGSIDWSKETAARPLLTKDELELLNEETIDDVLAKL